MIRDVILDAKNKRSSFLYFHLFFSNSILYRRNLFSNQNLLECYSRFVIFFSYILKKKNKKDLRTLKQKSNSKIPLSKETEREGFEPSVRMTRTTD